MHGETDIDPAWFDLQRTGGADEYEPAELLSGRLDDLAGRVEDDGPQRQVLRALVVATSAMLNPDDWLHPFTPAIQVGGRRSPLPSDLAEDDIALLGWVAPLVANPDLRARVADVAWTYGDRSQVALLDLAVDAYRAAPLLAEVWFGAGKDAWRRAFELARRRGEGGRDRTAQMCEALIQRVLACTAADAFFAPDCAALLRESCRPDDDVRRTIGAHLTTLAAEAADGHPRLSRHLEREASAWLRSTDGPAALLAIERAARTYLREADRAVADDRDGVALAQGHLLEQAVAELRTLPRAYRVANGLEDLIAELRERLRDSRERALEQMVRVSSDPVDLSSAVSYARRAVSGHDDRFTALAAFATLVPPMSADDVHRAAEEAVQGSISHIFGRATFSGDGRKVAATAGSAGGTTDTAVDAEVVRHVTLHAEIAVHGLILPAQELLTLKHRYDRNYLTGLCNESFVVPQGHAALWGAGLTSGLAGDYGPAVAVLVPQIEQAVRTLLKRDGAHTLHVDDASGVESEKSLNALLDMPEAADVLGDGVVLELRALLVVQAGANLRNDIAHGLLDDGAAWGYHSVYVWWSCLRLAVVPVMQMRAADEPRRTDSAGQEGQG